MKQSKLLAFLIVAMLALEAPAAYAVFGTRIARKAITHRVKQKAMPEKADKANPQKHEQVKPSVADVAGEETKP